MMIPILLVISAPKKVKIGIDGDWVLLHFEHLSQYYDMNHTQYHQFHNLIFCIFLCQFPLAWFRIHGLIQTDKYLKVTIAQKTCLQSRFMNPWLHMTPPVPNIFAFTVFVPSTFNLIWSRSRTKTKWLKFRDSTLKLRAVKILSPKWPFSGPMWFKWPL